jgi:hypothetical protein
MRIAPKPSRLTVKSPPKLNVGFVAMFDDVVVSAPRITSDLPARSAAPLAKLIPRNLRRVTPGFSFRSEALSCICVRSVRPRKSLSTHARSCKPTTCRLERATCSRSLSRSDFGVVRILTSRVIGERGQPVRCGRLIAGQHRTAAATLVRESKHQMRLRDFSRKLQFRLRDQPWRKSVCFVHRSS